MSKDGDSRSSAETCDKVLIILEVKINFLILSLNCACFRLDPQLLILLLHTSLKSLLVFSVSSSQRDADSKKITPEVSLFLIHTEQTQFPLFLLLHLALLLPIHPEGSPTLTPPSESPPLGSEQRLPIFHWGAQDMLHQMGVTRAD